MTTHQPEESPRPWGRVGVSVPGEQHCELIVTADEKIAELLGQNAYHDARLIVRAVNSHEALVTALRGLREAILPLVDGMDCYLQNCPCGGVLCDDCPGDDTCTCPSKLSVNAAMKGADAALAAATEGR
jgi:hypothetical protein